MKHGLIISSLLYVGGTTLMVSVLAVSGQTRIPVVVMVLFLLGAVAHALMLNYELWRQK